MKEHVEYVGHKKFDKDRREMARKGWQVVSVSEVSQPSGVMRILSLGLFALVAKPKSRLYVTYEKSARG